MKLKLLIEVVLSLVLHPLAMILTWISILRRPDLSALQKLLWGIVTTFAWGIGPIFYILFGNGALW